MPDIVLRQMVEAGYGVRRAQRELRARGYDVSPQTVMRRMAALKAAE